MDPNQFPSCSLRREILDILQTLHDDTDVTVVPPSGIMALLNQTGPTLPEWHVQLVEVLLDELWEDGLVGRMPAGAASHAKGYCIRAAVPDVVDANIPVFLRPLARRIKPRMRKVL